MPPTAPRAAGKGKAVSVTCKACIDALLSANEPGIEGVVVGRALYDGRIDVAEALRRAGSAN